jgi:hypothetical protein
MKLGPGASDEKRGLAVLEAVAKGRGDTTLPVAVSFLGTKEAPRKRFLETTAVLGARARDLGLSVEDVPFANEDALERATASDFDALVALWYGTAPARGAQNARKTNTGNHEVDDDEVNDDDADDDDADDRMDESNDSPLALAFPWVATPHEAAQATRGLLRALFSSPAARQFVPSGRVEPVMSLAPSAARKAGVSTLAFASGGIVRVVVRNDQAACRALRVVAPGARVLGRITPSSNASESKAAASESSDEPLPYDPSVHCVARGEALLVEFPRPDVMP